MARLLVLNGISRGSVEADFQQLIKRVSTLKGDARRSWRSAGRRVFDIGIQAGNDTRPFQGVRLSAATLGAVAALGVQVQLTIYRPGAYDTPHERMRGPGLSSTAAKVPSNIGLQPTAARAIMRPLRLKPQR